MLARAYDRTPARWCASAGRKLHKRQGYEIMATLAAERGAARHGAGRGESLVVAVAVMFGPSDKNSPNSEELLRWGVSTRQRRVAPALRETPVAQARSDRRHLPDPDLRYAETENWPSVDRGMSPARSR
jgi:ring-1,2-phenylacetyl-CoA epoxidase subunit PaaA